MRVIDKGDELNEFLNIPSTPLNSDHTELGNISQDILHNFNLDMDCDLSPGEDFLHELSNDLEIPMLLEESQHFKENHNFLESSALLDNLDGVWGRNDSFGPISDLIIKEEMTQDIKCEPTSPASSQSSIDSWGHPNVKKIVLETPPTSPQDSMSTDGSPPCSPNSGVKATHVTPQHNLNNENHQRKLCDGKPVIICSTGSGGTIRIWPYNTSCIGVEGNTSRVMLPKRITPLSKTKVISVQPKLKSTSTTTSPTKQTTDSIPVVNFAGLNGKKRIVVAPKEVPVTSSLSPLSPLSVAIVASPHNKNINDHINNAIKKSNCDNRDGNDSVDHNTMCNINNMKNLNGCTRQKNQLVAVATVQGIPRTIAAANTNQNILSNKSSVASSNNTLNNNSNCNDSSCTVPGIKIEPIIPPSVRQEIQMRVMKRQQRMIKNRESACLSRKKKKEYVSSLEARVADLENENAQLKLENLALKDRLNELETNFVSNKNSKFQSSNIKKTSVLLGVLLILSVNLGSIGLLKRTAPELSSQVDSIRGSSHHGRSLLWTQPELDEHQSPSSPDAINVTSGFPHNPLTCPLYINQTESLRLNSELRKWIGVEQEMFGPNSLNKFINNNSNNNSRSQYGSGNKNYNLYKNKNNARSNKKNSIDNVTGQGKMKMTLREEKKLKQLILPTISASLPSPPAIDPQYRRKLRMQRRLFQEMDLLGAQVEQAGLLHAIRRRDDTFYVVSFSGDHLLLPALAHNNTLRPKVSLVLPSLPLNGSLNMAEPFTMMQIDCEVLDTRLVELKETDIPLHLRTASTSTSAGEHPSASTATASANDNSNNNLGQLRPEGNKTEEASGDNLRGSFRPYFMRSHPTSINSTDNVDITNINTFGANNDVRTEETLNTEDYSSLYTNERRNVRRNSRRFP